MRTAWITAMGHGLEWFEALELKGDSGAQRYATLPHAKDAVMAVFRLGRPIPIELLPLLGSPSPERT